jgi:hypothetical protein
LPIECPPSDPVPPPAVIQLEFGSAVLDLHDGLQSSSHVAKDVVQNHEAADDLHVQYVADDAASSGVVGGFKLFRRNPEVYWECLSESCADAPDFGIVSIMIDAKIFQRY